MLNNRLRDAHRIEVSFPEAHIADSAEPVPAPRAGFFGIAAPGHLAGIAMGYQVAQKLHACTDPDDPPEPPLSVLPAPNCLSVSGPFPVWWTLVRFAVPDRVKGS